jgi:plasmid stabilization system protein ParE
MAAKPFTVSPSVALKGRDLIDEVERIFPVPAREAQEIRSKVAAILDNPHAGRAGMRPSRTRSRRAPRAARRRSSSSV